MKSWIVKITTCLLLSFVFLSPGFVLLAQQESSYIDAAYLTFTAMLALLFTIFFLFLIRRIIYFL
jgi:hypothetical protein